LRLGIPRRKRNPVGKLPVQADLKGVLTRTGEGHIEDQDGSGFDIDHTGGRLSKLDRALSTQQLASAFIHEADADGMHPDLGAAAPNPEHQVSARIHCREVREPDMLKHAQNTELSLLVDQGVIGDDREIEMQLS
jgi:hypothetical protein